MPEHHVHHHLIVERVKVMTMRAPAARPDVDFDRTDEQTATRCQDGIQQVGTLRIVKPTRIDDSDRFAFLSKEVFPVSRLALPDAD